MVTVIQALGEQLKVRQQVIATATVYFKRFYARWWEHNRQDIFQIFTLFSGILPSAKYLKLGENFVRDSLCRRYADVGNAYDSMPSYWLIYWPSKNLTLADEYRQTSNLRCTFVSNELVDQITQM